MSLTYAEYEAIVAYELNHNHHSAAVYAAVLGGGICLFSIAHLIRSACRNAGYHGMVSRVLGAPVRAFQRVSLLKVFGLPSVGHAALLAVYLGVNIALAVTNVDFLWPWSFFAIRCGWMAVINLAFTFFLALKNTPLSFLAGKSYEKLNVLHRWAGRMTFLFAFIHCFLGIAEYSVLHQLYHLRLVEQIHGQIAFGSMTLLVLLSISPIRTRFYSFFFKAHVFLYLLIVINVGMHKPTLALRVAPIVATIGGMWCLDRLFRTARMVYYSWGNTVTLIASADGIVKVVFKRHVNAKPGSHAFIRIPAIRKFESHPFTIVSPAQTEFLVRKQKGFTAALYDYAMQHPGAQLRAFFDGPYGAVENFREFEKVVFLAGGSGASFTFAVALDLIESIKPTRNKVVEFVWVVRERSNIAWFETELQRLRACPLFNITIHVTNESTLNEEANGSHSLSAGAETTTQLDETEKYPIISTSSVTSQSHTPPDKDIEAAGLRSASLPSLRSIPSLKPQSSRGSHQSRTLPNLEKGRPDIRALVSQVVKSASSEERIAVAVCGPEGMVVATRAAVAGTIGVGGPGVVLHAEHFGF